MRFLILSDIHGDTGALDRLGPRFGEADAVLFAGDFAEFGHVETGRPVLESLLAKHGTVFSVLGNCDSPDFLSEIEAADVSVEGTLAFHEGIAVCGSGGGTRFTGATPFEREEGEILSDFDVVEDASAECADESGHWPNLILIMHNPPKDTECDCLPNGAHVGSGMLRDYIERRAPFLVVTGHIHESAGVGTLGGSTVINPGSLAEGRYGWVEAEKGADGRWRVTKAELLKI